MKRNFTTKDANTLSWAALNARLDTIRALLDEGMPVDMLSSVKRTALSEACLKGHLDVMAMLLDAGANPNIILKATAGARNEIRFVRTALEHVVTESNFAAIDLLLDRGANPAILDSNQSTAAQLLLTNWLARNKQEEAETHTNRLLERMLDTGLDVNQIGRFGQTLLIDAILNAPASTCKLLLERGADLTIHDSQGRQPLHHAAAADCADKAALLIAAGADLNAVDWAGQTPLFLFKGEAVGRVLLEHGSDPKIIDVHGNTALGAKIKKMSTTSGLGVEIPFLLAQGADPDESDFAGVSIMDVARKRGLTAVVDVLAAHSARQSIPAGTQKKSVAMDPSA